MLYDQFIKSVNVFQKPSRIFRNDCQATLIIFLVVPQVSCLTFSLFPCLIYYFGHSFFYRTKYFYLHVALSHLHNNRRTRALRLLSRLLLLRWLLLIQLKRQFFILCRFFKFSKFCLAFFRSINVSTEGEVSPKSTKIPFRKVEIKKATTIIVALTVIKIFLIIILIQMAY